VQQHKLDVVGNAVVKLNLAGIFLYEIIHIKQLQVLHSPESGAVHFTETLGGKLFVECMVTLMLVRARVLW